MDPGNPSGPTPRLPGLGRPSPVPGPSSLMPCWHRSHQGLSESFLRDFFSPWENCFVSVEDPQTAHLMNTRRHTDLKRKRGTGRTGPKGPLRPARSGRGVRGRLGGSGAPIPGGCPPRTGAVPRSPRALPAPRRGPRGPRSSGTDGAAGKDPLPRPRPPFLQPFPWGRATGPGSPASRGCRSRQGRPGGGRGSRPRCGSSNSWRWGPRRTQKERARRQRRPCPPPRSPSRGPAKRPRAPDLRTRRAPHGSEFQGTPRELQGRPHHRAAGAPGRTITLKLWDRTRGLREGTPKRK